MSKKCQYCEKPILWLKHKETLKFAPIEAEPSESGNIFINGDFYRMATDEEVGKAKQIGKPLYINHFATCEFANQFRRDK